MSHHVTASSANPNGAVEVVHVHDSSATTAPVDGGGATGGPAKPSVTDTAGASGTPGANLPVEGIEQASNTIQRGRADLARTAGAERRLDGFDGVGGGGGGGAGGANANANNAKGAPAQATADKNMVALANQRQDAMAAVNTNPLPDTDPVSTAQA